MDDRGGTDDRRADFIRNPQEEEKERRLSVLDPRLIKYAQISSYLEDQKQEYEWPNVKFGLI